MLNCSGSWRSIREVPLQEEMLDTEAAQKNLVLASIETEIANVERQRQTPLTEDRIEALRTFAEELQRGIAEAEERFRSTQALS